MFIGFERRVVGVGLAAVTVAVAALLLSGGASGARASSRTLATFNTVGFHIWTVPAGVTSVTFNVYGASGGNVADGSTLVSRGGRGGEAKGSFTVTPGQKFVVGVGGRGADNAGSSAGHGGFIGGGFGGQGGGLGGAGGGGDSDVRIGVGTGNDCASLGGCEVYDRIVVGGGGGGGGGRSSGANGGAGGGLTGVGSFDGTQERGGVGGDVNCITTSSDSGTFGQGQDALGAPGCASLGGGGGGWFGGGVGNTTVGGGGGSGFVSRFARKASFPGGTRTGDGLVVISTP